MLGCTSTTRYTPVYICIENSGNTQLDIPHDTNYFLLQEMSVEGERNRLAMAGATGAIEEDYRQGLAAHAARHNKVFVFYHLKLPASV